MKNVLINGNEAFCRGAVAAGMTHYFGYPITPQNDVLEFLFEELPKSGGSCFQAESELGAISMVYGAAAAGGVTMTSSSSPGISLMQEGISFLAGARLPAVILNVVRGGPGLGNITPAQSDYFQSTRGGGHGDYFTPTLLPATVQEQYDYAIKAFQIAWEYRTPVLVQTDGMIGQMMSSCTLNPAPELPRDKSWAITGKPKNRERNVVRSLFLNSESALIDNNDVLQETYKKIQENEQISKEYYTEDAELVLCGFGVVSRILKEVVEIAREKGMKVGLFRPITGWPFPSKALSKIQNKKLLVVEMNYGQMYEDIRLHSDGSNEISFIGKGGGWTPSTSEILQECAKILGQEL